MGVGNAHRESLETYGRIATYQLNDSTMVIATGLVEAKLLFNEILTEFRGFLPQLFAAQPMPRKNALSNCGKACQVCLHRKIYP